MRAVLVVVLMSVVGAASQSMSSRTPQTRQYEGYGVAFDYPSDSSTSEVSIGELGEYGVLLLQLAGPAGRPPEEMGPPSALVTWFPVAGGSTPDAELRTWIASRRDSEPGFGWSVVETGAFRGNGHDVQYQLWRVYGRGELTAIRVLGVTACSASRRYVIVDATAAPGFATQRELLDRFFVTARSLRCE